MVIVMGQLSRMFQDITDTIDEGLQESQKPFLCLKLGGLLHLALCCLFHQVVIQSIEVHIDVFISRSDVI